MQKYVLSGPFNSVTETMYNNVVYYPDGTYAWYRGVKGVSLEVETLPFPPIDVEVG